MGLPGAPQTHVKRGTGVASYTYSRTVAEDSGSGKMHVLHARFCSLTSAASTAAPLRRRGEAEIIARDGHPPTRTLSGGILLAAVLDAVREDDGLCAGAGDVRAVDFAVPGVAVCVCGKLEALYSAEPFYRDAPRVARAVADLRPCVQPSTRSRACARWHGVRALFWAAGCEAEHLGCTGGSMRRSHRLALWL